MKRQFMVLPTNGDLCVYFIYVQKEILYQSVSKGYMSCDHNNFLRNNMTLFLF
jgi:hypothetical protein